MAGGMHVSRPVSGADGVGDNGFSLYALRMGVVFDEAKRQITLAQRGLDFADAEAIFAGPAFTIPDLRKDYAEERFITYGLLNGRQVVVVWTWRGADRRIISMRKANDREQARFRQRLD